MNQDAYRFIELFSGINEELIAESQGEWKKTKTIFQSSVKKAACFLLLIGVAGVCIMQPQVKAAITGILSNIGKILETKKDLMPYTNLINERKENGYYAISLNEVILSEDKIYADITMDSEKKEWFISPEETVIVNGEKYPAKSVSDQSEGENRKLGEMAAHHLYIFELEGQMLPDKINEMELCFRVYDTAEDWMNEEHAIPFDFSFTASREELEKTLVKMPLSETISLENGLALELKELTLTEVDSKIKADIIRNDLADTGTGIPAGEYYLIGEDSLGAAVWYTCFYEETDAKYQSITFEGRVGSIPSTASDWVDLQLYTYESVSKENQKAVDEVDGEEIVLEEDNVPMNMVWLGTKFRIDIK